MKILHITPSYVPAYRYGGTIKCVHELNKWLVKKGVDVVVYTTNVDGNNNLDVSLNRPVNVDGVKVFYFPITFRPWQYSYKLHRALAKNIKNFDLIHITSVFLSASTLGAYYSKKFEKPYIISLHGSLMQEPLRCHPIKKKIYLSLIEKRNLKNAIIHLTAPTETDEFIKIGLKVKDFFMIPNGLDGDEFNKKVAAGFFRNKFNISNNFKIVLFLNRLSWKKGLDTLIPAFADVIKKEQKVILVLAGDDDEGYKKTVDDLIDRYKIRDKIIFTGLITGNDMIAAFQDSQIFVLPSYSEACSMSMISSLYFGLPIIITNQVGFSSEIMAAGACLSIEKNVEDLSIAILKLLKDNNLRVEIGKNAIVLAQKEFSIQNVVDKFIKKYSSIIDSQAKN